MRESERRQDACASVPGEARARGVLIRWVVGKRLMCACPEVRDEYMHMRVENVRGDGKNEAEVARN